MINFAAVKRRRELLGATVLGFQCDGCMAEDHKFQWVGRVERFETKWDMEHAVVRVLKRGHRDVRDGDLGVVHIPLQDTSLQQLHGSVYAWFK